MFNVDSLSAPNLYNLSEVCRLYPVLMSQVLLNKVSPQTLDGIKILSQVAYDLNASRFYGRDPNLALYDALPVELQWRSK